MKRLQLLRWSGSVLSPRIRPQLRQSRAQQLFFTAVRHQSTATSSQVAEHDETHDDELYSSDEPPLPSPPVEASLNSPNLSALHSRLSLPKRLPLQTLARTLVDASADPSPQFNNHSLSILGSDLLSYYTAEYLTCTYPRLPMSVMWAAMYSYIGAKPLTIMTKEWGVEYAAEPGEEVDPALLQFKRLPPGTKVEQIPAGKFREGESGALYRRGQSARVIYDNPFGDPRDKTKTPSEKDGVTPEQACSTFVQAVMGAVYLHGGRPAAKTFFQEHFMSRHLSMAELFSFSQPTRDLSKLCAREGFESPVAKILSETGRVSRHPVFVVGIFSGKDKLGEGSGASLNEARFRAAAAALKGWYLYSPLGVRVPSSMEEEGAEPWKPAFIDPGEVIV